MSIPTTNEQVFAAEAEAAQAAAEQSDQVRAHAVEEAAAKAAANRGERTFTEVEVAAIRKQEKDKLYKQLEERDARLAALEADLTKRQQLEKQEQDRIQAEQEKAAEAARKAEEERMSFQELLQRKEEEWNSKLETERQERLAMVAQQEKEREYLALLDYRDKAVEAAREDILPQLVNRVGGNSKEEIDASIADLVALSESIAADAIAAQQEQRRNAPGTRVTAPGVGPVEINTENRQFTAQDIAGLSMDEYAKIRSSLGVGNSRTDRGMFR